MIEIDESYISKDLNDYIDGLFNHIERPIVLELLKGISNADISANLGCDIKRVKYYITRIYRKMNVTTRSEALVTFHSVSAQSFRN